MADEGTNLPITDRVDDHEKRIRAVERQIGQLQTDIAAIDVKLSSTASKVDLEGAKVAILNKLHESIVQILGDALKAVPAKQMVIWTAVTALCGLGAVAVAIVALFVR